MCRTFVLILTLVLMSTCFCIARDVPAFPKDAEFRVRLNAPISTETNRKGDKISAEVLVPAEFAGATMEGEIRESKSGNKFKGTSTLLFTFHTLVPEEGESTPVNADVKGFTNSQGKADVDEEGHIIERKNNLGKLAVGSGAGALVGGLLGGGKGAALGAGIGAGASMLLVQFGAKAPNIRLDTGSEIVLTVNPRRK